MLVSRNTSRCVIAASVFMLSSTIFISSSFAQSVYTGGTVVISGEQTVSEDFDLFSAATVRIENGSIATLTGEFVTNNKMLTFNTLGTGQVTGNIYGGSSLIDKTGAGKLTIDGEISGIGAGISVQGTLVLNHANTFGGGSGSILIGNGTLVAGDDSALSTARVTTQFSTATLSANKDVTLANNFSLAPSTDLTVDTAGNAISLTGKIQANSGGGSAARLIKSGVGTLTLSGSNTYAGGTVLNEGTLLVSSDSNLGEVNGGLTFNGGTLQFGSSFDLSTSRAVNLAAGGGFIDMAGNQTTISRAISGSGGLTLVESSISGNGKLTLKGMNDYTGATTISSGATLLLSEQGRINSSSNVVVDGTLDVSAASSAQIKNLTGSGSIVVGAAGLIINNAAGSFSGVISGSGGISVSSGNQILSGSNTYTGGTGISQGATLQIGNGGQSGAIATNVTNYGTLIFNRSNDVTYAGEITGLGSFEQIGSGKLTLTATSSSRGDVKIAGGSTLQLGNGGTTGLIGGTNFTGTITNDGTLIYNRSNVVEWKGVYAGNGDIVQAGSGSLILTGDSSGYSGNTRVESGTLIVGKGFATSKLGGNVTVFDNATLGGSGTLGSGVGSLVKIASGGTLSPGNSIGTLTINGDLLFETGSKFIVEVDPDGTNADLVRTTGNITLNGGSVAHIGANGDYDLRSKYTILAADGALSGAFNGVSSDFAFLTPSLVYDYDEGTVDLSLMRNDIEFASRAATFNQRATALAIESIGIEAASELYDAIALLGDDETFIRRTFDNLSGEAHASAQSVLIGQSQFVRNAVSGRLQQAFGASTVIPIEALSFAGTKKSASAGAIDTVAPASIAMSATPYTAWGYGFGAWSNQDDNTNAGKIKSSIGGFITGIDAAVLDTWRFGVLAGYSHSSFHVNDRSSSGSSDNYTLGTYAGSQWNVSEGQALAFRSGLSYTWHNMEMNRSVGFGSFTDNLSSDYDAGTVQLFGELGYQFKAGKSLLEPYANLAWLRLKTDGFDEEGLTPAALSVESSRTDTTFSTLGVRASTELNLGSVAAAARADIGWRHAYGDLVPVSTASFVGSDAFTVSGAPIAKDAALIEAGFDFKITKDATLGISYNGQFGSKAQQNGFNAKLSVGF